MGRKDSECGGGRDLNFWEGASATNTLTLSWIQNKRWSLACLCRSFTSGRSNAIVAVPVSAAVRMLAGKFDGFEMRGT